MRRRINRKGLPGSRAAQTGRTFAQERARYARSNQIRQKQALMDDENQQPQCLDQRPTIATGEGRSWHIPDTNGGDGGVTGNTYVSRLAAKTREAHGWRWSGRSPNGAVGQTGE